MFPSRPALRWLAPVAVLALVLAAGTTGTMLRADAAGALPPRTAAQLLVDLQKADPAPFSGTVSQQSDLGLPELPALNGGGGSSDLSSLVSGSHTLRVWFDGPQRVRLALLGTLGESDVVRNGSDLWMWSSQERSATHRTLPAKSEHAAPDASKLPADLPKTPQEAADQALKALDPTTKVTTDGTAKVAGRSAYLLILTPRDSSSLVGQVRLAIDGARHVPLQVQVFAKGASEPAFQVGFTSISFTRPSADQFRFTPPPGTKVTEGEKGSGEGPASHKRAPAKQAQEPRVVGKGWTSVVVATMPSERAAAPGKGGRGDQLGELGQVLNSLPRVSGSWGSGRLLKGSLFSVLVTDDGRVLAGAVSPDRLYSVAGSAR
ncbi:Outer membrane lipoprotein-sorting protein [Actinopolymorpha cephalotaxi]|uniref:Outer membrane lipoprotein-sorting protein n=1 Tax=Actinopolymorpha cephalotaxi TaxID=504797 RepID=A0A1I2RNH3_9ACTN|nr:sigma-E factor regulatory protein RseB domain-containing protein [Actinopolymorpha cephalotaxi]NYH82222.1 outer membrane lipoprotein-sorting protein [Actinopolymorpha cephalotaxi]SFG40177.1 Outer membrane lipoprotein-sorting protein [Actinopolymorpha cephalotaxi]